MYVRSLTDKLDLTFGKIYEADRIENEEAWVIDDEGDLWWLYPGEYEIVNDKAPALTSTTHVLKIEHKFKVTKTIDNTVQIELQHGVYSKDNVQELIDILVKVKEEM